MNKRQFQSGVPACPVACKYCFITEHDERRGVWNTNPVAGINKACTFINVTPWISHDQTEIDRFRRFPWEILKGDYVGFTAITDPFFPEIDEYLWEWLDRAGEHAKLLTCVSKWPISRKVMKRLSLCKNFFLVVTVTGNGQLERVSTEAHLTTLARAKEYGVKALPICHPYISDVSDLSFLPRVAELGYNYFDVKGFRYCDSSMGSWLPESSKAHYLGGTGEILPEDGWRKLVSEAGLQLKSPREWYREHGSNLNPRCTLPEADTLVRRVLELANVVSSDSSAEVITAAVERRL